MKYSYIIMESVSMPYRILRCRSNALRSVFKIAVFLIDVTEPMVNENEEDEDEARSSNEDI